MLNIDNLPIEQNNADLYNINPQTMPELTKEEMNSVKTIFTNDDDYLFVSTLGKII